MTLQNYRQRYAEFYKKITQAEQNLNAELEATKIKFDQLFKQQQEIDKRWFAAHLDFFLKYKEHFRSDTGLGEIIIDFLPIFRCAGMVGGAAFSSCRGFKIKLGDLLDLWDNGFTYRGYPIISYEKYIRYGVKIIITYVKNGRIETTSTGYLTNKNPLALPEKLMTKVAAANIFREYPNWRTYKTIDTVRNVLDKKLS